MYFSTFVLIMIVTIGSIAFGAAIFARLLNLASLAAYRAMTKSAEPTVPTCGSLSGEWLRAASGRCQPGVFSSIECQPLEGELVSERTAIASKRKFLASKV